MHRTILFCFTAMLFALVACKTAIDPGVVIGKWNYIRVGNPYSRNPDDTVSKRELVEKRPYITLSSNGEMTIVSEGKILSHGKYKVTGNNIEVSEQLPDGKTRNFLFYIIKLTGDEITFETKEDDAVRVTAIRAKQ